VRTKSTLVMEGNSNPRGLDLNKEGRPPRAAVPALHLLYVQEMCPDRMDFGESEVAIEGADLIRGVVGASTLLNAIAKILTQKASVQTSAS
jgi:hypothetical protein